MSESPFLITFPGASVAEANRYAAELAAALRDSDREVRVEQQREREDTQDFGATLAIILGTASVTAVAKGIQAWLARRSGVTLQIRPDGSVEGTNLDSADAARIAEAFARARK